MITKNNINIITNSEETIDLDNVFDSTQDVVIKTKKLFTVPKEGFEGIWSAGETIELEVDTQ